jgi:Adenine specific DNA methylase Mod
MYERLLLIKELLRPGGSLFLHLDMQRGYVLRVLLDEVFGTEAFRNEITWQRTTSHADTLGRFGEIHDVLLFYVTGGTQTWNESFLPYADSYIASHYNLVEQGSGRRYQLGDPTAAGIRTNLQYEWRGVRPPAGRHWAVPESAMAKLEQDGRFVYTDSGMPRFKRYLDEMRGNPIPDVWTDISPVNAVALEKVGFPTQKPEALIRRILQVSTHPGDIVLDCFIGSGTTAAVAQKLGRRWIGADINKGAIQTTEKRLSAIIEDQAKSISSEQLAIEATEAPRPAQLGFSVHRVNDYDLQIQHNEAVNLAVEHLGAERTKTDSFFHGTLGRALLYIVPLNHPCSLLDLEAVAAEIRARPEEQRDVVVVALGRELACDGWLIDYNRIRPINKVRLIELRTDQRYGKFFEHRPASARVRFEAEEDGVGVTIDDFLSPSIIERLSSQEGVLTPQITDWRAMVDSVFIDEAYDGEVFNVILADIPERRQDLVEGTYTVSRPAQTKLPIAVRITDMLGEEVLIVEAR